MPACLLGSAGTIGDSGWLSN